VVYLDKGYALLAVANAAALGEVNHGMNAVGAAIAALESHHSDCPEGDTGRSSLSLPPISSDGR
jgi:hypothetical protein